MTLCDTPAVPLSALDDNKLLALSRHWGRVGQVALRRFLATLPEISARGLYRRCGCQSIFEYAAKFSGATREVVSDLLLVYQRIGQFAILWSLFAAGKVGLTVFRRISRHVTADNAAWWADVVQTCTSREIEAILKRFEPDPASLSGQATLPLARPANAGTSAGVAVPGSDTDALARLESTRTATSSGDTVLLAAGSESPRAGEGAVVPEVCPAATACASLPEPGVARQAHTCVELTPLANEILDNLWQDYRRRKLTVSKPELLELLLKAAAMGEILPAPVPATAGEPGASPAPDLPSLDANVAPRPSAPRPSGGRRCRLPRILIEVADVGLTFLWTVGGLIPLSQPEVEALDGGKPPLSYSSLLARAIQAGEQAAGRQPPALVKLAISIRSAGKCEAGTCAHSIEEFDHLTPYSQSPVHRPDRMVGLCRVCHRARHDGLVLNPDAPPQDWQFITVGSPRRLTAVDRLVHEHRQRARSAVEDARELA